MKRVRGGLTLIALAAFAMPVAGQQVNFDNYCTTGAFHVCASVRVSVSADGKTLNMQVWNLEGSSGIAGPHAEPGTITAIGLYHMDNTYNFTGNVTGLNVSYVNGGVTTDVSNRWNDGSNSIGTLGGVSTEISSGANQGHKAGIVGCTDPGPASAGHLQTCDSFPGSPYVMFTFTFDEAFSTESLQMRWHAQQLGPDGDGSIKCEPSRDPGDEYACGVVPEPFTLALLGSGLAGLGGAAAVRRRRRRGLDVVGD